MAGSNYYFDWDTFADMLEARRLYCYYDFKWDCPDFVWERFLDAVRECGNNGRSVMDLVDNMLVNGNWGYHFDYLDKDEIAELKDENGEWDENELNELIEYKGWDAWGREGDDIVIIVSL